MRPRPPTIRFPLLASLIAVAALAAGSALAGPTLDRIKSTGAVVFGYRVGAAPFSFADRDGRARGYSVELCEAIARAVQKQLGLSTLKVEWKPVDASTRLDAVERGDVDAVCGTTTITLTRMEKVDFSVPIYVDGGGVLTLPATKIARLVDLKGKRIAVIAGTTTQQALVRQLNVLEAPATLVPVRDGAEGLAALLAGKADGYAGDRVVLASLKQRSADPSGLAFVDGDFSFEPYALVVRRDDPDFRLAVNRALVGLYRDGGIDAIFQRWLGHLGRPGPLLHAMFYLNTLPE